MRRVFSDDKSARDVVINIRAQKRQRELIDYAAATLGKNRSDFMLEAACREAQETLLDRRVFLLDDEAWQRFNTLLETPPRDLPRLRKLLTTKAPWEK